MDKYFSEDEYETQSPYLSGFVRKSNRSNVNRGKTAKSTYETPLKDAAEKIRNFCNDKVTGKLLNDLKTQYLTLKLRRMMAVELLKNRVGGDLKRIVERINEQARLATSKEFVVIGGGPGSLSYCTHKKRTQGTNQNKAFTIEIDVRGYIPENVMIDTHDKRMSIRAVRVSGIEKVLGILAPSVQALEKLKIHPPKAGVLILQYPAPTSS